MTKPYQPIPCALHDQYEIAIMHKKHLRIRWSNDEGEPYSETILPKDILVKDKQEFLLADGKDGEALCIRLDKITILEP
jgi:transcriptional antiterminator Rof (Rho-off)